MKKKYVLAKKTDKGNVTYWRGTFTSRGAPSSSVKLDEAKSYDSARDAYADGQLNGLGSWRAVNPFEDSKIFNTHWWA